MNSEIYIVPNLVGNWNFNSGKKCVSGRVAAIDSQEAMTVKYITFEQ